MKRLFTLLTLFVCAFSGFSQTAKRTRLNAAIDQRNIEPKNTSNSLPIRRVILYSNGVAYIERRGTVNGNAEVNLSFKQSQVDDVLKSMVVLDLGKGKIGAVSYNSSAPASARTAEIPFSIDAESTRNENSNGGLAGVLSQLQGAKVMVTSSKGTATGSILTVERRKLDIKTKSGENPAATENGYSLVVASETGEITSFDLSEIRAVKLLEEMTRHDINEFANATASTRRRDAKTITITNEGIGDREMVVSYAIAAPIWKTTYRVVLDEAGKPFFQGWAIVDNVSEEDWNSVKLSLVSGSPVSFIQNLQKPLYRYRPIIPIPDDLNLEPQIYDAASGYGDGGGSGSGTGSGYGSGSGNGDGSGMGTVEVTAGDTVKTEMSDALMNLQSGITAEATGRELGDLFEYRIDNAVTVPRNRSALIPIIQTKMDGERVSIYNESVNAERPMGGMLLTNTSPLTFEGGSLTVLDRDAYAGEALMERLKPKEDRLISFALDLGTRISTEEKGDTRPAQIIKVVDGVFQVHYFKAERKTYHLTNQTDREKVIYVEHPFRKGWILDEATPKPETVNDKVYRFRVVVKPFEKTSLAVVEKQGLMDSYGLRAVNRDQLELFVKRGYIDDATRAKLEKLIDMRQQINRVGQLLTALDSEVQAISNDQARLRENIESLAKTPEAKSLIARYIAKAGDQETRLAAIAAERKSLLVEKERLETELAAAIKDFEIK